MKSVNVTLAVAVQCGPTAALVYAIIKKMGKAQRGGWTKPLSYRGIGDMIAVHHLTVRRTMDRMVSSKLIEVRELEIYRANVPRLIFKVAD